MSGREGQQGRSERRVRITRKMLYEAILLKEEVMMDLRRHRKLVIAFCVILVAGFCVPDPTQGVRDRPMFADEESTFSDAYFGIEPYSSGNDADGDGVDDQADVLASAKEYLAAGGRTVDGFGNDLPKKRGITRTTRIITRSDTDVVAYALLHAGYDMREDVAADLAVDQGAYPGVEDDLSDMMRERDNQVAWLDLHAEKLTTKGLDVEQWHGGDIVALGAKCHMAVVSDRRNSLGVPYIIHTGGSDVSAATQAAYEQDMLRDYGPIVGHWRVSPSASASSPSSSAA